MTSFVSLEDQKKRMEAFLDGAYSVPKPSLTAKRKFLEKFPKVDANGLVVIDCDGSTFAHRDKRLVIVRPDGGVTLMDFNSYPDD